VAGVEQKGGISKWLFNHALSVKLDNYRKTGSLHHWFWDRLVFGGVQAKLGGRVKVMLTGAAPLSPQVLDFLRVVFACDVFEGYGMTESCAISCVTHKADQTHGQVGGPVPSVEIKLVDIPEMGYTSKDQPNPRGEVWIRGPTVFKGYHKNDQQTIDTVTKDGWLVTGDVGMFDEMGRLFIIDRKKALFKLAQGEYISPEKIEIALSRCPMIAQAFVDGNSLKSFVVAVVVPDAEVVMPWAKSHGIGDDFAAVCKNPRTKEAIVAEIVGLGSNGSKELKGFEVPKAIHVESEQFSVENDLLTPTFKMKRPQAKHKYESTISSLYDSVQE
jgi:long-chain acyl-CoA synthetase